MPAQPPTRSSAPPPTRRERRELARAATPKVRARATAPRPPAWRSPFALVSLAAVVVIGLVIILIQKPASPASGTGLSSPPSNAAVAAGLAAGETLGKADAPVALEIFSDFQCPVCASLVKDYLPRFYSEFVIPGQVRIVARDIAFLGRTAENESLSAAVGARCAGVQGKYWQYHDWLFYNQRGENQGAYSSDRLRQMADGVGLDRAAWDACTADPAQAAAIRSATSQANAQGIASTPTFRFAGQLLTGLPRTYADLAAAIRKVLPSGSPGATRTAAPTAAPTPAATK